MNFKNTLTWLMVFFIMIFTVSITFAEDRNDIFQSIVSETKGNIIESGISVNYQVKNNGKQECINWLKSMNLYNKSEKQAVKCNYNYYDLLTGENDIQLENAKNVQNTYEPQNTVTINNGDIYCREFQKGKTSGYVESIKDNTNTKIEIFIRDANPKDNINNIEDKVSNIIEVNGYNISVHKYMKVKSSIKNRQLIQNKIVKYLKNIGTENIDTVKINEGFSTVGYTKQYVPISDDGKNIDFNFAVIKESNKNFIILGTPIIDISY
jgi:hypothetical protein